MSQPSPSSSLSVAVFQLTSVDDVNANLARILALLERLGAEPPDLVCLPENALYLRLREGEPIPAIDPNGEAVEALSNWSRAHGSAIHVGSVPLARDGGLFNSSLLLTPDGKVSDNYQKIHLFDVDVEGHKPVRESDVFCHGREPSIFEINGWKLGSSICYDVRFSELYLHYARLGVDALLMPSAFLVPTGQAHWEILVRARAIECQAYVLAAAQGGDHFGARGGRRATYGHSMIVDPWGFVVDECPEGFGEQRILRATLTRERINQVRSQIPMKNHRRLV